ncbi:MAG: hypothetical protein IPO93_13145 [Actinobacteria bacterium]|jgi:hypothetical protein|nr:hypothetical protein [Actinomycetota bacterium]
MRDVSVDSVLSAPPAFAALPMEELRTERMAARRALELAHLRMRQEGSGGQERVDSLHRRVLALTEELIRRYQYDLSLVDGLLDSTARGKGGVR